MPEPEEARDPWERPTDVPPDQEWFWTPEWIAGEREASADFAAGRGKVFYSGEEFLAYLEGFDQTSEEAVEPPGQ
ncbi:hypothetical protein AB0K52_04080 [Glycomyces sp. NPDC049804]|uniref:hypothetical protein n=1 Tax=Glycomyces sp. NPDC049804 TaxID=3154363 RepID=UPI00341E091A